MRTTSADAPKRGTPVRRPSETVDASARTCRRSPSGPKTPHPVRPGTPFRPKDGRIGWPIASRDGPKTPGRPAEHRFSSPKTGDRLADRQSRRPEKARSAGRAPVWGSENGRSAGRSPVSATRKGTIGWPSTGFRGRKTDDRRCNVSFTCSRGAGCLPVLPSSARFAAGTHLPRALASTAQTRAASTSDSTSLRAPRPRSPALAGEGRPAPGRSYPLCPRPDAG
jgi:hypothetical protein